MKLQRLTQAAIVVGFLVVYELATRLQLLDPFTFVPLSEMVSQLGDNLSNPSFVKGQLWPTAIEILFSFAGAAVLGIIIGIILWRSDYLYHVTQPYFLLFYAVPFFAIYPIFVSIFGLGPSPVIAVGLIFAMPAVVANTAIGFRETREALIKVGKSFNLSFGQMLLHVYFPAAWPHIFTGLRLAAAYSIISVLATEFILSSRGIGYSIAFAYNGFDLKNMYASVLFVIVFAALIVGGLEYFEARLYRRSGER